MELNFDMETIEARRLLDKRKRDLGGLEAPKTFSLQSMNDRHHEIARLHMLGLKNVEIAERLGITPMSVSQCLNSPVCKMQMQLTKGVRHKKTVDMLQEIQDALPEAMKVMKGALLGGKVSEDLQERSLQLRTAEKLMAMGGHGPIRKVDARTLTATLSGDDIRNMVKEAQDLGKMNGFIVPDVQIDTEVMDADFHTIDEIGGDEDD